MARRNLCGVPRDGRTTSANHPTRNLARCLASFPHDFQAIAGQCQQQCRRASVKTTRKMTRNCRTVSAPQSVQRTPRHPAKHFSSRLVGIPPPYFNHPFPKIMNSPTASLPTPNLELLRKAVQEYQPDPNRVPFSNLKPLHDSIVVLRGKNASYAAIAELLIQNGVKTSRARVAEYGRIVLEGGRQHKRRKRARITTAVNIPAAPQSALGVATKVVPTAAPSVTSNFPPSPSENSPYKSRGPHIANVRMMSPEEAKEFNDSLKSKPPAS